MADRSDATNRKPGLSAHKRCIGTTQSFTRGDGGFAWVDAVPRGWNEQNNLTRDLTAKSDRLRNLIDLAVRLSWGCGGAPGFIRRVQDRGLQCGCDTFYTPAHSILVRCDVRVGKAVSAVFRKLRTM